MKKKINIEKTAKLLKRHLKGNISVKTLIEYLGCMGYKVVFINTEEGDDTLQLYGLKKYSLGKRSFTYIEDIKLVFIDNNLCYYDTIYSLLHEIGHILLGHLDDNNILCPDNRFDEAEADAFLYEVIRPRNRKTALNLIILCIAVMSGITIGYTLGHMQYASVSEPSDKEDIQKYSPDTSDIDDKGDKDDFVIITKTGKKFHREGCVSINGKDCIIIPRTEAEKTHEPCKLCNP